VPSSSESNSHFRTSIAVRRSTRHVIPEEFGTSATENVKFYHSVYTYLRRFCFCWPLFFPHGAAAPSGPGPPHCRGFTDTLKHTTLGRTPLDEWSARRRDLYLLTHNTHKRQTCMPPAGFEAIIPASVRPQTQPLDRAATGIGDDGDYVIYFCVIILLLATYNSHSVPFIITYVVCGVYGQGICKQMLTVCNVQRGFKMWLCTDCGHDTGGSTVASLPANPECIKEWRYDFFLWDWNVPTCRDVVLFAT
jgi:hypothetical protein